MSHVPEHAELKCKLKPLRTYSLLLLEEEKRKQPETSAALIPGESHFPTVALGICEQRGEKHELKIHLQIRIQTLV